MKPLKTRNPESLGNSIFSLLRKIGIESKVKEFEVIVKWSSIVGERVAKSTHPERVVDGILFVKVKNSVWRNELIYMKKEILSNIDKTVGTGIIKDIRYI